MCAGVLTGSLYDSQLTHYHREDYSTQLHTYVTQVIKKMEPAWQNSLEVTHNTRINQIDY